MRDFGQEQGRSKVLAENQEMANESKPLLVTRFGTSKLTDAQEKHRNS